ncbi:CapA family protein [Paenibacillus chondroitinus]|uniref:CapA family protein n=1 Tax=Paenibacillus chondroitinus TaxID=59842 RepID=A0ABU6DFB4_9BACL|nr:MULTISPECIES: CapA family protein [Paenibacillus]MCY9662151.1 CapA family protein [Paenibacillus anseongense]MEB4795663.1 CapA family protein [Paenibacillus chondroitinus]
MQRKRVVVIAFLLTVTTGCFYRANPPVHKEAEPQVKDELLDVKQNTKPEATREIKPVAERDQPPTSVTVPTIPPIVSEPKVSKVTLGAIGDVLIHIEIYQDAKQKDGTYNFFKMFEDVQSYLRMPDILVANQETMIGGKELRLSGYPSFNSPQEVGDALKAAGVDLVTVANNHTLDRGEKVIQSALSYWDRLGIPYTGSFKSKEDQKYIRTMVKNNITFSFLSYAYGTNGIPHPKGKAYLVNRIDTVQIAQEVAQAKRVSDVVVVAMHWGTEYETLPNESQMALAQKLADYGVHIVIGNHPHVLQPPAWVSGSNGHKTLVLYSLGNFISAQGGVAKRVGGMATIDVIKTMGKEKTITLKQPSFLPTFTSYQNMTQFKVLPLKQAVPVQIRNGTIQFDPVKQHMRTYIHELRFIGTE